MKNQNNEVWIGVEQLTNDPAYLESANQEFHALPLAESLEQASTLELTSNRRDFLKYLGFGLGAATLAASCEIPVRKAVPYVVKPDTIVPGVATYYASSFVQGGDYCSILVKTREGRPIKIEGNSLSSVTKGGTSARAQASVLSLYDTNRIDGPYRIKNGAIDRPSSRAKKGPGWAAIDGEIMGKLQAGSRVRILTNTLLSPTTKQAIADFTEKFPNTQVVTYDPVSASALLEANAQCFGEAVVPNYQFDKADVIVSFEADFLGTWISPVEYANQYAKNRTIKDAKKARMSRHIQVESHMSLTGSNADNRIMVKPSEQGAAIIALYNEVAALTGGTSVSGAKLAAEKANKLKKVAKELVDARGKALVVSGSNNLGEQVLINAINMMVDSYGNTIDLGNASMQRQGIDSQVQNLIREMKGGQVDALLVLDGANPAWDLPNADQFRDGMKKVGLKVSFSILPNETTVLCDYATPTNHFLESWGDAEAKRGHYSLIQPTIAPLFDTRQTEVSLLTWAASEKLDAAAEQPMYAYLAAQWAAKMFPQQTKFATFQAFWDSTLHDGVFEVPQAPRAGYTFAGDVAAAAGKVRKPANGGMEISFFETVNMGGGQYANNPWLAEMPDPVARTTWGNYLAIPVKWEGGNSFKSLNNLNGREIYGEADMVDVEIGGKKQTVTVVRQFGQLEDTVGLAIGFGRELTGYMGKALGEQVGVNAYPWLSIDGNGNTQYYATGVTVSERVGKDDFFACVQYHHSMGVTGIDPKTGKEINVDEKTSMTLGAGYQGGIVDRSIIYKANLSEIDELVHHVEERRAEAKELNSKSLYPYDQYEAEKYSQGHWWGMHVDLNACIGCGACQVACIAENNVPVVGKHEVGRHHEMAWLRIDRYFFGDYENPNVVYQPMMCQHCDNAPCENVCPVAATPHSSEGLNQMTYNRCIGTRYCANNCPYKVRRFNWLDYTTADLFPVNEPKVNDEALPFGADNLTRMVLNPDVTVRSRGVIEKCSFCVQRIQEGKLTAKREGRRLNDNDVKTACQTACPTGAIVFGDRNDKQGNLGSRLDNPLNYIVLEETNVRSSVNYTAKVVNRDEKLDA
ncbi:MAG: TAT-variant-translocated molybdopterin oxidoreductase [Lewinellaceae bacterium]|nr:TAT-variant-translocated molybdopterin oxidoreductase [Lewinellaceae bacterium]